MKERLDYLKKTRAILSQLEKKLETTPDATNKLLLKVVDMLAEITSLLLFPPFADRNLPFVATRKHMVDVAGTAKQFPVVLILHNEPVTIKALSTNTGIIYIGNSKSEAEDHTKSFPLEAGDTIEYKISNLSQLWADSTVSEEGVFWTVEQEQLDG